MNGKQKKVSFSCLRTGEMILELKRDKERKGAAYKSLAEDVFIEDEVTEVELVNAALR